MKAAPMANGDRRLEHNGARIHMHDPMASIACIASRVVSKSASLYAYGIMNVDIFLIFLIKL
jgi:hypothetical protein